MVRARVVVVGGGIAGLASAFGVVRRAGADAARDLVLLEREPVLGAHATGQNAAILRTEIDDPALEDLAVRGARFLSSPPRGFAPAPLLDPCGLVVVDTRARAWNARAEHLSAARRREIAPHLAADSGDAWYLRDEGRVDLDALVAGFSHGIVKSGARIRLSAHVRELVTDARGAVRGVSLDDGETIECDRVVLAAGAWAARLGRAVGSRVSLSPTRRHLLVTEPDPRVDPRWPIVWSDADGFYARPHRGGLLLCPCDGDPVDPDRFATSPNALEAVRAKAARVVPGAPSSPAAAFWAGVRTHASDGRFVLGSDPDLDGLVWAAALGGHGITCAAAVGEFVAEAVLGGSPTSDTAQAFSPARATATAS